MTSSADAIMQNSYSDTPSSAVAYSPLKPWLVCFTASLFFFFEFMQVNMFNSIVPALMETFNANATTVGLISANYFYANVIFLFPAGLLLDRFSTRTLILLAMSVSVTATIGLALSQSVWQASLCRFITGIGGSFCLLSCVRLSSRWFSPQRMALIVGLIVTMAMVGATLAQTPFTLLSDAVGWRHTLLADGALGVLISLAIFCFVEDFPPGAQHIHTAERVALSEWGFWKTVRATLGNVQNWLGGLYTSLMNLPILLLGALWGNLYLVQMRGFSRAEASLVSSMIFIGTIVGSPTVGWLSDYIRQRKLPMVIGAILGLVLMMYLIYAPSLSFCASLTIFFALGFITSAQIISYPLIAESNPPALTGSAEGLASMLIMSGGFTQPLFAKLMELSGTHKVVNHVPIYSAHDFHLAFMMMPIAFVFSFFIALLVRETRCRSIYKGSL